MAITTWHPKATTKCGQQNTFSHGSLEGKAVWRVYTTQSWNPLYILVPGHYSPGPFPFACLFSGDHGDRILHSDRGVEDA